MSGEIEKLILDRDGPQGLFEVRARISQRLKDTMQESPNWHTLPAVHKEGLEMIVHKIARILCGDYMHEDHTLDIAGYSTLILQYTRKLNANYTESTK